jgi:hypothetical protein
VEIVTVALEVSGAEVARPFIEAAAPEHPSLIDAGHEVDARFGVVNIPNGVWIDEEGMIVRPAEPAWSGFPRRASGGEVDPDAAQRMDRAKALLATRMTIDRGRYVEAVRDWARRGADSPYALTPDQVVARSHGRGRNEAEAAAHFELAQHLWRTGSRAAAIEHFRAAHHLYPANWTYKRQAWGLVSAESFPEPRGRFIQGPRTGEEDRWPFESDFLRDVEALGPDEYYPPMQ